jgi:2-methylcitrate dehydratase PrpD
MSIARELAKRITAMRADDMPAEALAWSRIALLDTVGVTLAGAHEEAPRIVEEVLASPAAGPSLVFGGSSRIGCLDAALINGTAAHALDYDNATNTMFGHASATMLPALLAAGEAFGGSGRDLLAAHVAGFETGARLGRGLNMHHYEKGWHPTSTLGVFAVAAACAHFLKLTEEQTATALALATSLAAGIKANFGTMTKPLHVGQCARGGLMAALLARKGFTANPDAFEHKQGYFNVFNGAGNFEAAKILEGWGEPLDIVAPGACYKQYPCCASTHAAVDAALDIRAQLGPFDPAAIARVESWTSAQRLAHTNRPQPASSLDAKFSVQYCVARALLDGKVVFEHLEGEAYRDPKTCDLLARVHAAPFAEGTFAAGNHVGAEVKVTLADGRAFSSKIAKSLGRTSANPVAPAAMLTKFESCAARVLPAAQVHAVAQAIEAFERCTSIRAFTTLLETAAPVRAAASA